MTDGLDRSEGIQTFLIADVRGYTTFTQARGDEAAARLAAKFAALSREGVEARGGRVIELRGDEALAVFSSPRQASGRPWISRSDSPKKPGTTPRFLCRSGSASTPGRPYRWKAGIAVVR